MQIFLENKYTQWYYSIIAAAQNNSATSYVEEHHIIPSSLGGNDEASNLVKLNARQHFIVHLLLTKMTTGLSKRSMSYAFSFMLTDNSKLPDRHLSKSRWYEYSRKLLSETQKGRQFSEETRERMKLAAIQRYTDPVQRSKVSSWTKNPSPETREKIGQAARNRSTAAINKMKLAKSKRCTIDGGRTIYQSKKELAAQLGWGKSGAGSIYFQYLD